MFKLSLFLLLAPLTLSPLFGNNFIQNATYGHSHSITPKEPDLLINNRPVAKINGKVISLMDVVKKMDLILQEYGKEYLESNVARYQFYSKQFEPTLDDMISSELMLLDAEQKKISVTDGQVREELESRFGPNMIENLEIVHMTHDEAYEMIRSELIVNQLMGVKVHSKTVLSVTPNDIQDAYSAYLAENSPKETWKYQVLALRGQDKNVCEKLANEAFSLLTIAGKDLDVVHENLLTQDKNTIVSLSEEYSLDADHLSKQHFEVLKDLAPNSFSKPVAQISRFDNSTVYRIFYLNAYEISKPAEFNAMHDTLKNQLLQQTFDNEKKLYVNTLKKRFGYDKQDAKIPAPEGYQPFILQNPQ